MREYHKVIDLHLESGKKQPFFYLHLRTVLHIFASSPRMVVLCFDQPVRLSCSRDSQFCFRTMATTSRSVCVYTHADA